MATMVLQYVYRPNPGADMAKVLEMSKRGAEIWKKHGAEASVWAVTVGEVGNMVLALRFASAAAYGAAQDGVNNDPQMQAFRAELSASGNASWVRSNLAREVAL